MGKVKPGNDSFTFDFVIGGLEPESECIFHVDPIQGGQNQPCTTSLSIGCPIYRQPPDGEIGRELGGLGKLGQGEFHDEICQKLSFDRCSWLLPNIKLTQLYGPFYQSSSGFWFMQYLYHWVFCQNLDHVSLEVWSNCSYNDHQC